MEKINKFKLKVGDTVWARLPVNAKIIKVGRYGYTLQTEDGTEWSYFSDSEVDIVTPASRKRAKKAPSSGKYEKNTN